MDEGRPCEAVRPGLPRWADWVLAAAALIASAPIILASAALVRLTSRGPAFFRQVRVGRGGRGFVMVKLRSMRVAPEGPAVTASGDARVTRVGRVLRNWKLDELPEFWNVLRGEMALVGPRPEVPRYVDLDDPAWCEVLCARPGITDPVTLWLRNEEQLLPTDPAARDFAYRKTLLPLKLDRYREYLHRRSWRTDVIVLLATALAILRPRSARPDELRVL